MRRFHAPSARPVHPPVGISVCRILRKRRNSAYYLASQLVRDVRDHTLGVGQGEGDGGTAPSDGDQQEAGLLRPLVASVVALAAAWLLRRTAPPSPGARGRKRVKVN